MRIGVDGLNLALARGTGVATYARTLGRTAAEMGWPVDLVFGLGAPARSRTGTGEAAFLARLEKEGASLGSARAGLGRALERALVAPWPRDLVEVPVGARAQAGGFDERLPPFDRLFTLGGLFSLAERHFRRYRRFLTVRVPDPPAVMHWTYPVPVRLAGAANLYTLHDLVPLRLPQASLGDKAHYRALIAECVRTADRIVTVSETSRRDIIEMFPTDPVRVVNTYQPVEVPPDPPDRETLDHSLAHLFGLKRDGYFLFFGAIEPKKNVGRLIEAYLAAGAASPLVIVQAGGWSSEQELRLLDGSRGQNPAGAQGVRMLHYLPRPQLMTLVRGARAVIFPSLYEGFGLPAAEALALGAPLIASNAGALPEVVGEAAVTVDPYDVGALAAAISRLDRDEALRARLAAAGPQQVRRFSPEIYRRNLEQLYRAVAAAGRPDSAR